MCYPFHNTPPFLARLLSHLQRSAIGGAHAVDLRLVNRRPSPLFLQHQVRRIVRRSKRKQGRTVNWKQAARNLKLMENVERHPECKLSKKIPAGSILVWGLQSASEQERLREKRLLGARLERHFRHRWWTG